MLDRAKAVGGSGVLVHLGTPTLSIRDYAALMVTLSDNTATNVLIDRLGMDAINVRDAGAGPESDEAAPPHDGHGGRASRRRKRVVAGRAGQAAAGDGWHACVRQRSRRMPAAVELLKLPKESRLRRGIPEGVQVADKPGELDGVRADAGIVFVKNRPYAFVVMTTYPGG